MPKYPLTQKDYTGSGFKVPSRTSSDKKKEKTYPETRSYELRSGTRSYDRRSGNVPSRTYKVTSSRTPVAGTAVVVTAGCSVDRTATVASTSNKLGLDDDVAKAETNNQYITDSSARYTVDQSVCPTVQQYEKEMVTKTPAVTIVHHVDHCSDNSLRDGPNYSSSDDDGQLKDMLDIPSIVRGQLNTGTATMRRDPLRIVAYESAQNVRVVLQLENLALANVEAKMKGRDLIVTGWHQRADVFHRIEMGFVQQLTLPVQCQDSVPQIGERDDHLEVVVAKKEVTCAN